MRIPRRRVATRRAHVATASSQSLVSCKPMRRTAPWLLLLVSCLLVVPACKTQTEATAAAHQLNKAASDLEAYYGDLCTQLDETVTLNEVQSAIDKIPFGSEDRTQILDVRGEISKRAAMAHSLTDLANAYGNLAGSSAGADAATSASALADELSTVKAIPGGSGIPDIAGAAAKLLVEYAQTRSLKKGALGVSQAVTAVSELFDGEKPAYVSIE